MTQNKQRKRGKFLKPIDKEEVPLDMRLINHFDPMPSMKKRYFQVHYNRKGNEAIKEAVTDVR